MSAEHTVYIRNLNEKLTVSSLRKNLTALFNDAGFRVLDVQACKNLKLRGQAFVSFAGTVDVNSVVETFNTKMVCGKPMNVRVAKAESDLAAEKTLTGEKYKQYIQRHREARLLRRQQEKEKAGSKKRGLDGDDDSPAGGKPASKRTKTQEKAVPNHILIITGLPKDTQEQDLIDLFTRYSRFLTVNLVLVRQLALVEFQTEENAVECVDELGASVSVKGQTCTLAFAKK